jgi:chitinase
MYWDASQAYGNNRFDKAIKAAIKTSGGSSPAPPNAPSTPAKPTDTKPAAPKPTEPAQQPASGSCSSAKPWSASTAYTGGQTVSEGGKLWKAQWWTQNEKPGAAGGVWKEAGSCNQRRSRFFRV